MSLLPSPTTPPNILLVVVDQMRATALGCAGIEQVRTPHLDAFASQGTRFTRAISNTPACTPARATMWTGKHVLNHGLVTNDMCFGYQHQTLAHCLNDAGYRCGYIGKLHVDGVNRGAWIPPGPRRLGFDDFWAGTECNHRYLQGYRYAEESPDAIWFDGYEPDAQTDLAIDYLQRCETDDRPFCLVLSWAPPHCPYDQVPQRFLDLYPPAAIEFLPNAVDAVSMRAGFTAAEHDRYKRRTLAAYYAQVTALDECFGRLLASLDQRGLGDDTIVVFTSDHGDMLFSQNRGWKCKPWRESVNVPLLIRWPQQVPSGRISDGPVGLVDLMPTLLGLVGAAPPAAADGLDLSALVRGDDGAAPESQYINFPCVNGTWSLPGWRGVMTRQHTYAAQPEGPWLLYDDLADPHQLSNLVGTPAAAAVQQHLAALLQEWLRRTGDDFAPASVIADRYAPGHRDCAMPLARLPAVISQGPPPVGISQTY